ncbi:ABC transporter permease [Niallia sp. Krafla_26]|uniref:ABC transporter permease n=1 Tax=Niallia sp. Krafla_26 TaxID=3064703 RepID=UPI003D163C33
MGLIFTFSPELEKIHVSIRTKPFLFRHSKQIFKKRTVVNGFIELFIKAFLRDHSYIAGYFQIISVTIMATIVIPPLWLKGIIIVSTLGMLYLWLNNG